QTLKKEFNLPITFRMLNETCGSIDLLANYLDQHLPTEQYSEQPAIASRPAPLIFNGQTLNTQVATNPFNGHISANADSISLLSQQISLISQQIALLQGGQQPSNHISNVR